MTPDLTSYDVLLVNSSAGKDSQAMLDEIAVEAKRLGILDRVVVVHCDLEGMEWAGTRELAQRQAAHYGVRFEVVKREDTILAYVERRDATLKAAGKVAAPWPSSTSRWCTSDFKRGPVRTLMTRLAAELRAKGVVDRPARILNCMGLRAEESPARAKKIAFEHDVKASNGRRHVDTYLPIFDWTTAQVWDRIKASGVEHHRAYDLGMGRLSCALCIFAPKAALLLAGHHNRELLEAYVDVEKKVGFTFRKDLALADVLAEVQKTSLDDARAQAAGADDGCWNM